MLALKMLLRPVRQSDELMAYLLGQLDEGAVAQKVRDRIDPRKGSFFAILPEGLEPEQVENWAWERPEVGYPQDPAAVLCNVVKEFLLDGHYRAFGLDTDAAPGDIDYSSPNLVTYRGVPGWEVRGPNATNREVEEVASLCPFYPIYFYRSGSPKRTALDDQAVDEIAENLLGLAVGALDLETYLIWWRTDLMPLPGTDKAATD